jgi:hypothetical protein
MGGQGLPVGQIQEMGPSRLRAGRSAVADRSRQHLLDFDRDPVAVYKDHARGNRQGIGEDFDLICLGGVEFDDGTPAQAHYLMNRHRRGSQDHHEVDTDFIEGCHVWKLPGLTAQNCAPRDHHGMVSQWLMTAKASI